MDRIYRIAGKKIEIVSLYDAVQDYCSGYETDSKPDFTIETLQADITAEREHTIREYEFEGLKPPRFSDAEYEITAVYRKIADKMIDYDTFVFHGSVIAVDGVGYLFTAKSGTGKSTHTRLWREMLGDKAVMVNDDKPLISVTESSIIVYGTPWNGKHRLGENISVPLKAICILERSADNHIEPITKSQAYAMLLQQVYRPQDSIKMAKTLRLIDKMAETVKLYKLGCNMDISAAEVAYNAMKG